MIARVIAWGCVLALACAPAQAQETVTFDIRFADPVLTPGETQYIEVWAILEPGIGASAVWNTNGGTGQLGVVAGIADARFDFTTVTNGQSGVFSGLAINPQIGQYWSIPGAPDGEGNVINIEFGQWPAFGFFYTGNPVLVWSCQWSPIGYSPRTVEFTTHITIGPDVYLDILPLGHVIAYPDTWAPLNPIGSFRVMPAPGGAVLLGAGVIALTRRRRGRG